MGMEVVPNVAQVSVETIVTETDNSLKHEKENGILGQGASMNEPIKFGSHGADEQAKASTNDVSVANFPKDAADVWPEPKQIHSFYFVRYRPYEDPKIKAKLDIAEKELQKKNQNRFQIIEALRAKRSDRGQLISQLKSLGAESKQFRMAVVEKRKEMEPLQEALGKLRGANNAGGAVGLCSSEEELDWLIQGLKNRTEYESIPLKEEKKIIRDISLLEKTRKTVIEEAAKRTAIMESLGPAQEIKDQVKLMGNDLGGVKREKQAVMTKIKSLDSEVKVIDNVIKALEIDLETVTQKRDEAYESLKELRKQRDGVNSSSYQNRSLLNKARELAAKRDLTSLRELSHTEMETFMSAWSSNKAFRDDYEKRILRSLDSREMSRDGRIRNPNEKPLVAPATLERDAIAKVPTKQPNEDIKSLPKQDPSNLKAHKEASNKVTSDQKSNFESIEKESKVEISGPEEPQSVASPVVEIDPKKLKEMKREEEIAKAKQAMERKKKLAEKAAAKAAVRAQKEAEKKDKEREKKAKKKAATTVAADNLDEAAEVAEPDKTSEDTVAPAPPKKDYKEKNTVRDRRRLKGPDTRPKPILKRKKVTNYWVWAAPVALILVLLLVLGYFYLL